MEALDSLPMGLLPTRQYNFQQILDMQEMAPDQAARIAKMIIDKLDTKTHGRHSCTQISTRPTYFVRRCPLNA